LIAAANKAESVRMHLPKPREMAKKQQKIEIKKA
jgi:hypothetical protein